MSSKYTEISLEDLREMQRQSYLHQRETFLPVLMRHYKNKEWEKFIDTALAVYEVMPDAFQLYEKVPDNLKYQFAVKAYIHHGDSIPSVRKAVRGALKYGKPVLPKEIADAEEVIVYRAGEEPIEKARYRISWTTDKDIALFFLNEWNGRHASHLYKGKIRPDKIIAYTDDRSEKEIMQYMNVYDITEQ